MTNSNLYTVEQIISILAQHDIPCTVEHIECLIKNDVLHSTDFYHVSEDSLREYLKTEYNINSL